MDSGRKEWVLLAGPTASGKTALAVELALRLNGEIISADSMQIYRGCAIGTAQPSAEELRGVPSHLAGTLDPREPWSVADWLREARACANHIQARGRTPIIVGGTGLYFKALTEGLFESQGAVRQPELRSRLESEWDTDAGSTLRERLEKVDPAAAARIHPNDRLRVVRALEVFEATGRALTELQAEDREKRPPLPARRFILTMDRAALYRRIDERVEEMMRRGFAAEARALADQGATEDWPAMRALGYPQMLRLVRGLTGESEAVEETQKFSRRYAKQQMVLYRQWWGSIWLDAGRDKSQNAALIQKTLEFPRAGAY